MILVIYILNSKFLSKFFSKSDFINSDFLLKYIIILIKFFDTKPIIILQRFKNKSKRQKSTSWGQQVLVIRDLVL